MSAAGFSFEIIYSPFMFVMGAAILWLVGEHLAREKQIHESSETLMLTALSVLLGASYIFFISLCLLGISEIRGSAHKSVHKVG